MDTKKKTIMIILDGFDYTYIEKNLDNGENFRTITLTPYGERYNYIKELKI